MAMFGKILLAVDLDDRTPEVLDALYSLGGEPDTVVYLLHVVPTPGEAATGSAYYKRRYNHLLRLQRTMQQNGYDHIEVLWRQNASPGAGIRAAVQEVGANLIIMLAHDEDLLHSTLRGSVSLDVEKATQVPMVIVRGEPCPDLLKRVLVPTDFSRESLLALDVLRYLHERVGEVIFVHSVESARDDRELRYKRAMAHHMLQELVDEMRVFGIRARGVLRHGWASQAVGAVAEEEQCTLIFTGKTNATLRKLLLHNSTTQNIAQRTRCSLFILDDEADLED